MQQIPKLFADELNKSLDATGAPKGKERAGVLSKLFHIPKQQAWAFLEGYTLPNEELLKQMGDELEFDIIPFLRDKK